MTTRNLRSALLGSAVGVGLLASGGQAHALSTEFGELKIFFDTTVSVGVSMKTKDARQAFLSEFNGGNVDLRTADPNVQPATVGTAFANPLLATQVSFSDGKSPNFDDSANTDDRFLNFGAGDLTSANIKANHDLQMTWRNFTLFARATEFYDAVLNSDGSYNRFGIDDNNREEVGRDIRLLDLYLSADFDVGSLPVNFRAGKQVISWGEGTFIFNGINSINPVDVSTFRRPGVEIKEGLIPVWALYGSVGLPFDLSLEAFYQLDWEPFQLDPAGTPFAGSDVANPNSSFGGNQGIGFYSGSIAQGFNTRNCTPLTQAGASATGLAAAGIGGAVAAGYNSLVGNGCSTASSQHYLTDLPSDGSAQGILLSGYAGERGDPRLLGTARGADQDPSDSGQWGVALRWYSEELNSTEFGFYYMNYHSRLPIAQVETAGLPQVVVSTQVADSNLGRSLEALGCQGLGGGQGFLAASQSFANPGIDTTFASILVDDPNGSAVALAPLAQAILGGGGRAADAAVVANGAAQAAATGQVDLRTLAYINCAILGGTGQLAGSALPGILSGAGGITNILMYPDGGERLAIQQNLQTRLLYPEDIQLWGLSFNTTIGDWGVQGEFSFRPNQPLQIDTTQQTITGAGLQCVGGLRFLDAQNVLGTLSTEVGTQPTGLGESLCGRTNFGNAATQGGNTPQAFVREEVFTFQIGTTATYTNSNPLINFLGADIGILVTEFGLVHVPDVPDELPLGLLPGQVPEVNYLAEVCRSGTSLPLGSVLGLDQRGGCSPTDTSYGGILLTRLDYNNVFGTPWTLSPQLVYRHDLEGFTPAPLGNFVEDRRSIGLSVTANLQNTWTVGLSYTDFMGSETYQNNLDDDFVSLTASYSF